MESQIYWILFGILVILLSIFSIYLVLNIVKDFCISKEKVIVKRGSPRQRELLRYNFDKSDVEDLTKFEGDLRNVIPRLSFTNEVDTTKVKSLLKTKSCYNRANSEERDNTTPKQKTKTTTFDEDTIKKQSDLSKSIDDLECWDPTSIEVMKSIHKVETKAQKMEGDVKDILGHLSDLKYYEINEEFIRLQIELCDIYCDREELRKRKTDVFRYIQKCQLDLRAGMLNESK